MFLSLFDPIYVCKQNWEKGIELCKALAKQYESELYDFVKLSNILVRKLIFELSAHVLVFVVVVVFFLSPETRHCFFCKN